MGGSDDWVVFFRNLGSRRRNARLRLFCFPYAGASAWLFRSWVSLMEGIEICSIQLPGHGTRLSERPFHNIEELVPATGDALLKWLDKPFAFFGHSMGALIAFELARFLQSSDRFPKHLIVSGCRAPQVPFPQRSTYMLPDREFLEELRRLKGTPTDILNEQSLMSIMLPTLRADFSICQTYRYRAGVPLRCPIAAFAGEDDAETSGHLLDSWCAQSMAGCSIARFSGDHFYLLREQASVLRRVSGLLEPYISDNCALG